MTGSSRSHPIGTFGKLWSGHSHSFWLDSAAWTIQKVLDADCTQSIFPFITSYWDTHQCKYYTTLCCTKDPHSTHDMNSVCAVLSTQRARAPESPAASSVWRRGDTPPPPPVDTSSAGSASQSGATPRSVTQVTPGYVQTVLMMAGNQKQLWLFRDFCLFCNINILRSEVLRDYFLTETYMSGNPSLLSKRQFNQERLDSQFNNVYFDNRTEVMWMFTVFGILDPCEMSSGLEGGGAEHRTGIPPGV